MNNDELSIFIDELGDFGKYDIKSPYYIAVLVFHNQSIVISDEIERFNHYLEELEYKNKSGGDNYFNKRDIKNGCSLQPFSLIFFVIEYFIYCNKKSFAFITFIPSFSIGRVSRVIIIFS